MRSSQWKYWFPVGCFPVSLVLVIVMIMKGPVVRTGPMPTTIQIGGHEYEFPPEMIEQLISGGPTPMARLKFRWEDLGLDPPMRRENRRVMVSIYKRSEEPTSELQSLMRNSYAVFCLKK